MITDDEFWYQARHENATSESIFQCMLSLLHTRQTQLATRSDAQRRSSHSGRQHKGCDDNNKQYTPNDDNDNKNNKDSKTTMATTAATTTTLAREEYRLMIAGMEGLERAMGVGVCGDEWQKREDTRRQRARELLQLPQQQQQQRQQQSSSRALSLSPLQTRLDNDGGSAYAHVTATTMSSSGDNIVVVNKSNNSNDMDEDDDAVSLRNVAPVTMRVLQQVLLYAVPLHPLRYNVPAMSLSERTSCCVDNATRELVMFGAPPLPSLSAPLRVPPQLRGRGCVAGDGFVALLTDTDEVWAPAAFAAANNSNSSSKGKSSNNNNNGGGSKDEMDPCNASNGSAAAAAAATGSGGSHDGEWVRIATGVVALAARRERMACLTQQLTVRPLSSLITPVRSVLPARRVCFFDLGYGEDYYMVGVEGGTLYKTTASRRSLGTPRRVMTLSQRPIARVACGESFVALIDQSGHLLTMGRNKYGQLGCGRRNETRRAPYEHVDLLHHFFVQVAAGERHTLALASNGVVYGAGSNEAGQLGLGNTVDAVCRFVRLPLPWRCIGVAAGPSSSMFACDSGAVFACGDNTVKQLGVTSEARYVYTPQLVPQLCDGVVSCTIDYGGYRRKTPSSTSAANARPALAAAHADPDSSNAHGDAVTTAATTSQHDEQQRQPQQSAASSSTTRAAPGAASHHNSSSGNNNNNSTAASRPPALSTSAATSSTQQQQQHVWPPRHSNTSSHATTPLLPHTAMTAGSGGMAAAASSSTSSLPPQQHPPLLSGKRASLRRSPGSVMHVHLVDDSEAAGEGGNSRTTASAAAAQRRAGDHEPIMEARYAAQDDKDAAAAASSTSLFAPVTTLSQLQRHRRRAPPPPSASSPAAAAGTAAAHVAAPSRAKCGGGGCCSVM